MQSKMLRRYYKRGFLYNIIEKPPLIGKLHYDRMPLSNEMGKTEAFSRLILKTPPSPPLMCLTALLGESAASIELKKDVQRESRRFSLCRKDCFAVS